MTRTRPPCTAPRVLAAAVVSLASLAHAQIVLKDQPREVGRTADPRWLGNSGPRAQVGRRILVDKDLKRSDARDLTFDADAIRFRDPEGRPGSVRVSDLLAILPADAAPRIAVARVQWREISDAAGRESRLETIDAQVLPGRLAAGEPAPDSIRWQLPTLGPLSIALDRVALIALRPGATVPADASADVVAFTNGDIARGVVDSISASEVRLDASGKVLASPLDRVSLLTFANPRQPAAGARAWLRDGTVIAGRSFELSAKGLRLLDPAFQPDGSAKALEIAWDDLVAANLDAARAVPLATLPIAASRPLEGRDWADAPRVDSTAVAPIAAADIALSGPIEVRWTLPAGASRLSLTALLPASARAYGDCDLVIEPGAGSAAVRERLRADRPTRDLIVILTPSDKPQTLIIRVESGESGPIQARVVLQRAIVLVNPPRPVR